MHPKLTVVIRQLSASVRRVEDKTGRLLGWINTGSVGLMCRAYDTRGRSCACETLPLAADWLLGQAVRLEYK